MKALPSPLPTISTARLRLRALQPGDGDALFKAYGDAQEMRLASVDAVIQQATASMMRTQIERLLAEGLSDEWGIVLQDPARLVGTCSLHGFEPRTGSAEVGCLLTREFRGQGYMREALSALFRYAAQELRLVALRAEIDELNTRSIHLFLSLGFQKAGTTLYVRKL